MLKVLPVQSKEEQAELCSLCGIPFDCDDFLYRATVDEKLVGICAFSVREAAIKSLVKAPESDDEDALFVMGRATMSFMEKCGLDVTYFDTGLTCEKMIKRLGYRKNESGRYYMSLSGFFDEPCRHTL